MGHEIGNQAFEAIRILLCVMVVHFAYKTAKDSGEKHGRLRAILRCGGACLVAAMVFASTEGSATCASRDDRGCDEYNDDARPVTDIERAGVAAFWLILLGTPVGFGVMEARRFERDPWGKPKETETAKV